MKEANRLALQTIEEFVGLARTARRRAIPVADRERLEGLAANLRDSIDGAVPGARPITGRMADRTPPATAKAPPIKSGPRESPTPGPRDVPSVVEIKPELARKLNRVGLDALHPSTYTPSRKPSFLDAYYDSAVKEVEPTPTRPPSQVVDVVGTPVDLPEMTLDLWNVGGKAPVPEAPDCIASEVPPSLGSGPQPAVVHLLEGGTERGFIAEFDDHSGCLHLTGKDPAQPAKVIDLKTVLVIFFGRPTGMASSPKQGTPLEITLVNDRRLIGFSPDYRPKARSLTVIPKTDRGGVDRVWVPAWSVRTLNVSAKA